MRNTILAIAATLTMGLLLGAGACPVDCNKVVATYEKIKAIRDATTDPGDLEEWEIRLAEAFAVVKALCKDVEILAEPMTLMGVAGPAIVYTEDQAKAKLRDLQTVLDGLE